MVHGVCGKDGGTLSCYVLQPFGSRNHTVKGALACAGLLRPVLLGNGYNIKKILFIYIYIQYIICIFY